MFKSSNCQLQPGSIVWGYLRDSGGEGQDLASQRAYLLDYCKAHKLKLIRIFEDAAISGGSVARRNEFELMVRETRRGKEPLVDGILYWDLKRFARNDLEHQFYSADLRLRGYKLISLSDNIPDNDFSGVVEALLRWKAQQDLKDISKDVVRGLNLIVGMKDENGNYLGLVPGKAPSCFMNQPYDTGLKRNNGNPRIVNRWVPDPDTWELGKRAWAMRADRATYQDIQQVAKLFPSTISNVSGQYSYFFRNQIYIGRFRYSGQLYENFVPALTDLETWEKVQALNYKRPLKGSSHPEGKLHPKTGRGWLLAGLCECAYCQTKMTVDTCGGKKGKGWRHYICQKKKAITSSCESKRIGAKKIEGVVLGMVVSQIFNLDYVNTLVARLNSVFENIGSVQSHITEYEEKIKGLRRGVANLLDMAEKTNSASVLQRLEQREQELRLAEAELQKLHKQVKRRVSVDPSAVMAVVSGSKRELEEGEFKVRQKLIQRTVKKVEVSRDKLRIHCRFPVETLGDWFDFPRGAELIPWSVVEVEI